MMTQEAFDILDEMYGGLIPQQDLDNGTYEWVCDYAGGKFYTEIDTEIDTENEPEWLRRENEWSDWYFNVYIPQGI